MELHMTTTALLKLPELQYALKENAHQQLKSAAMGMIASPASATLSVPGLQILGIVKL